MDKKKYTIGIMIGNVISLHIVELIEGIYRASADMQINVFFFLGIHSGYYYNLSKECSVDKDFDYLKEINDVFGHAEGDFAIKYCGETLNKIAGEKGIVGRIGGDEFCILIPGDANMGEIFIEQIFSAINTFNLHSDKPYYVELSIGYTQIVCEKDLLIAEEMKAADLALYEVKKRRRESVRK